MISVTKLLTRAGYLHGQRYPESARRRGEAVHRLTAELDRGTMELTTIVSRYRPYVLSYLTCVARLHPDWQAIEHYYESAALGLCGKPDRAGYIDGRFTIVDLKTGGLEAWHRFQLELYALLAKPAWVTWADCDGLTIHIDEDSYAIVRHRLDEAEAHAFVRKFSGQDQPGE